MPEVEPLDVAALVEHLDLGRLSAFPLLLKEGTSPVWKVQTSEGLYHVKVFTDGDWEWRRAALAGAREVEQAAIAAGVDTAEPITLNAEFGTNRVTVHRWLESRPLESVDRVHYWLGATLATLHTISPPVSSSTDSLQAYHGLQMADDWARWSDEAASKGLAWAAAAKSALTDIHSATELVFEGLESNGRVGSHRDLLPQNILVVPGGGYRLIDWDLAGPALPWPETIMTVMDIGRFAAGRDGVKAEFPSIEAAAEIFRGYLRGGGEEGVLDRSALTSVFGMALGRISHAMWPSLGHRVATESERQASSDYLMSAVPRLRQRLDAVPHVLELLVAALTSAHRNL